MNILENLLYSEEHEWVKADGKVAYVGVTDFAQEQMGDVVFVELPEVGDQLAKGAVLAVLESVKAASEVYLPMGGKITAVNEELADDPALINEAPYDSWIAALELHDPAELDGLMDAVAYAAFCAE